MIGANVIFTLDGVPISIQCNENDVMRDICQKYANKIQKNINSLVFLYEENQLNINLKFKDVIIDKENKEMKVLVHQMKSMNLYVRNVAKKSNQIQKKQIILYYTLTI